MTRRHRLVPTIVLGLAAAAAIAPNAQARPIAYAGGGGAARNAAVVERTVHDQPLANPVSVPASGLNHGAGLAGRTRPIAIASSEGTDWIDLFVGATAGALIIAVYATGLGVGRRAHPAT
jgi:hypothetical protein